MTARPGGGAGPPPGEFRAGGTDLQERLHTGVSTGPVVDLAGRPGLDHVRMGPSGTRLGALVRLAALGRDPGLERAHPALVLTVRSLATPQIRAMATLGGALCQRTRCSYYRHPELACPKKGTASRCPARTGSHPLGVCFDRGECVHPHPSSLGAALLTYDATVEVDGRGTLSVAELFGDGSDPTRDHVLEPGELLTEVVLPPPVEGERAAYRRAASRASAEWPLVEAVVRLILEDGRIGEARVAVGGVATVPLRLGEVEAALRGREATREVLEAAAARATDGARPLRGTAYKVPMVRAVVADALGAAAGGSGGAVRGGSPPG